MKSEDRAQSPIHAELTGDSCKQFISPSLLFLYSMPFLRGHMIKHRPLTVRHISRHFVEEETSSKKNVVPSPLQSQTSSIFKA